MDSEVFYVCDAGWRESSYDTLERARQEAWDWVTATAGPRDDIVTIHCRYEEGQYPVETVKPCALCEPRSFVVADTPNGPQVFCGVTGCGAWLGKGWVQAVGAKP